MSIATGFLIGAVAVWGYKKLNPKEIVSDMKIQLNSAGFQDISQKTYVFDNSENLLGKAIELYKSELSDEVDTFGDVAPQKIDQKTYRLLVLPEYRDTIKSCEITLNEEKSLAKVAVVFV